ncbi:hypothetical protein BD770DRAFT_413648 [Pilaira anomala]|nr:hypothetical protein BD770DRAFT_413648 [Pilaira anomala]
MRAKSLHGSETFGKHLQRNKSLTLLYICLLHPPPDPVFRSGPNTSSDEDKFGWTKYKEDDFYNVFNNSLYIFNPMLLTLNKFGGSSGCRKLPCLVILYHEGMMTIMNKI